MRRHHFYSCKLFKIAKFHEVQNKSKCLNFNMSENADRIFICKYK
mgnify:CR=1 FL=1